jgi:hypothetical protein
MLAEMKPGSCLHRLVGRFHEHVHQLLLVLGPHGEDVDEGEHVATLADGDHG